MNRKEAEKKFKKFIDAITPNDSVAILHDTDCDGMCAGVLAKKGLEQLGKNVSLCLPKEHGGREVSKEFLEQLEQKNITHIVCVDLALENYTGAELLKNYKVLVLDHHPTTTPYEESFTIIKPSHIQNEVPDYQYCAAHLVYTLFSTCTEMETWDWLAIAGLIGDMTFPSHKTFVEQFANKYGMRFYDEAYDMDIAALVKQIGYGSAYGSDTADEIIFSALDTAKDYKEAVAHMHEFDVVKEEQETLLKNFATERETHGSVHFYELHTKYHLASAVSSILSRKQIAPDQILITFHDKADNRTSASARRQDCQLHMGDMMRACTENFEESNGGGHIPAAGAKFPSKYKEQFKKNILSWVQKHTSE